MSHYLNIYTSAEVEKKIAEKMKQSRLKKKLKRVTLSEKSGVSLSSIKRFETTGKISLSSLLKIAHVLDSLNEFLLLFPEKEVKTISDLEKLEKDDNRKRGSL